MPFKIIDNRTEKALMANAGDEERASAPARAALSAASRVYAAAAEKKSARLRARPATELSAPVISVGNITWGGTGKTPVCIHIAQTLAAQGKKPGIATRGYGRKAAAPALFSPGQDGLSWRECGDEALLYLRRGFPVAVDPDRARGAKSLIENAGCDSILLDDGFQFITLKKHRDIVLLDAASPFGNGKLIPAGPLREPVTALERADMFWLTGADRADGDKIAETKAFLESKFPGRPVIESRHKPESLEEIGSGRPAAPALMLETISKRKACALSGIGSPVSFESTVEALTDGQCLAIRYSDHHPFTTAELERAEAQAREAGCETILTTEKDAMRIPAEFKPSLQWLSVKMEIEILDGKEIDILSC